MSWEIVSSCRIPLLKICKIGRCLDKSHRCDLRSEKYSWVSDVSTKGLTRRSQGWQLGIHLKSVASTVISQPFSGSKASRYKVGHPEAKAKNDYTVKHKPEFLLFYFKYISDLIEITILISFSYTSGRFSPFIYVRKQLKCQLECEFIAEVT